MMGFGLIVAFIGYCLIYWGVQGIQGKDQAPFISYVIPFGK